MNRYEREILEFFELYNVDLHKNFVSFSELNKHALIQGWVQHELHDTFKYLLESKSIKGIDAFGGKFVLTKGGQLRLEELKK